VEESGLFVKEALGCLSVVLGVGAGSESLRKSDHGDALVENGNEMLAYVVGCLWEADPGGRGFETACLPSCNHHESHHRVWGEAEVA
jgi:hypothetical protein